MDYKNASESYVKRYVYDGQNQMKAVFVNGEGIDDPRMMIRDEDGNTYFEQDEAYAYTKDHLGSVREIVDHKGEVRQRYSYSSYGETKIAKIGNGEKLIDSPYGFTGRELDLESGDYYYRARYYDPQTGRFLSQDPIGFAGGDTNLYRYVNNNPVNFKDPSGLDRRICTRRLNSPYTPIKVGNLNHTYNEFRDSSGNTTIKSWGNSGWYLFHTVRAGQGR